MTLRKLASFLNFSPASAEKKLRLQAIEIRKAYSSGSDWTTVRDDRAGGFS
jgi:hypothetical protein